MPTATPDDVRDIIDTDLSNNEIAGVLADAQAKNEQVNDVSKLSTTEITQIEAHLAALRIRASRERAVEQASEGEGSVRFGGDELGWLRQELDFWDPSGELAQMRDTDRHVTTTGD